MQKADDFMQKLRHCKSWTCISCWIEKGQSDQNERLFEPSLNVLETSTRFSGYTESNVYDSAGNPTTVRSASGIAYNGNENSTTHRGSTSTFDKENRMLTSKFVNGHAYCYRQLRAQQTVRLKWPPE
jgi:hypothetical protein